MREPTFFRLASKSTFKEAGWTLKSHGRLAWLQRLLWSLLLKMGSLRRVMDETETIIRLPCGDDALASILDQYDGLFSVHRKPKKILIGPEAFDKLMGCREVVDAFIRYDVDAVPGFNTTFYKLPISVVPQMEGVLVLD